MKKLTRLLLHLCASALLIFALYLNFVRKEKPGIAAYSEQTGPVAATDVKEAQKNTPANTSVQTTAIK
jgi:uncharacterized protein YhdP